MDLRHGRQQSASEIAQAGSGAAGTIDAPALTRLCRITARVDPIASLGMTGAGERRYVPIVGGTVEGLGMRGEVLPGGVDWQTLRADGVLEIAAHYVLRMEDGARIEVRSEGVRRGPPAVMARLAAGEAVGAHEYYFRTFLSFCTGAPAWSHLNDALAIGRGAREPGAAVIEVFLVG